MHKVKIIKPVTIQETYVRKASYHASALVLLQEHVQTGMKKFDFVFESHYRANKPSAGYKKKNPASSILFIFTEHTN